ncbi:MAG TPA: ribonuclease HII [Desulfomonilia bacterium]
MALEEGLLTRGVWPLCGIDEAGRGPLAGPVVAASAVISPASPLRNLVKDSKKLSPSKREHLYELLINSDDVSCGIAMVDEHIIDKINILKATMMAMEQSFNNLNIKPVYALVDGNKKPNLSCECIPVVGGDATEPSISAASIIAKVTRDRYMSDMDGLYPGYGFRIHKGYPTKAHYSAIRLLGPCPIHRKSFKGVLCDAFRI